MKHLAMAILALSIAAATGLVATAAATQKAQTGTPEHSMRIRIIVEGNELTATIEDTAVGRDFATLLPLDLTLEDYHGIEKIAGLPKRLSTKGAPAGVDPDVGDITYYAPWGNLALFYGDFGYARGLVRLGRIHGDVTALGGDKPLRARIERVEPPN